MDLLKMGIFLTAQIRFPDRLGVRVIANQKIQGIAILHGREKKMWDPH